MENELSPTTQNVIFVGSGLITGIMYMYAIGIDVVECVRCIEFNCSMDIVGLANVLMLFLAVITICWVYKDGRFSKKERYVKKLKEMIQIYKVNIDTCKQSCNFDKGMIKRLRKDIDKNEANINMFTKRYKTHSSEYYIYDRTIGIIEYFLIDIIKKEKINNEEYKILSKIIKKTDEMIDEVKKYWNKNDKYDTGVTEQDEHTINDYKLEEEEKIDIRNDVEALCFAQEIIERSCINEIY